MAVGEKDPVAVANAPFDKSHRNRRLALAQCHDEEPVVHVHLDGEFAQWLRRVDARRENEDQRRKRRGVA